MKYSTVYFAFSKRKAFRNIILIFHFSQNFKTDKTSQRIGKLIFKKDVSITEKIVRRIN